MQPARVSLLLAVVLSALLVAESTPHSRVHIREDAPPSNDRAAPHSLVVFFAVHEEEVGFLLSPEVTATASPVVISFYHTDSFSTLVDRLNRVTVFQCGIMADSPRGGDRTIRAAFVNPATRPRVGCKDKHKELVIVDLHFVRESPKVAVKFPEQYPAALTSVRPRSVFEAQEYPFTTTQLSYDSVESLYNWEKFFLENHAGPLHPFQSYNSSTVSGVYNLADGSDARQNPVKTGGTPVKIAITADWGAGTKEAAYVAQMMMDPFNPEFTFHLGDIYYVGLKEEVESNMLGIPPPNVTNGVTWPKGSIGSFATQGNHEMYSRGWAFFDTLLPTLGIRDVKTGVYQGQIASYTCLENEYWKVIMLDTGYNSYRKDQVTPIADNKNNTQMPQVMSWLKDTVKLGDTSDTRGVILMAHHQFVSAFSREYTATPAQIATLVGPERKLLWLWGHEHRLSFYKPGTVGNLPLNVYGRCIGNGGFPTGIEKIPERAKATGLLVYDNRVSQTVDGIYDKKIGFNGWVELTLTGANATLEYYSLTQTSPGNPSPTNRSLLVTEHFVASAGSAELVSQQIVNPDLTRVDA